MTKMTKMIEESPDDGRGSLLDEAVLDRLMEQVDAEGLQLLGPDGVLTELTSRLLSKAMAAELTEHLGYEHGDRAGWGSGNSRNGTSAKTVLTDAGPVPVGVPETVTAHSNRSQPVAADDEYVDHAAVSAPYSTAMMMNMGMMPVMRAARADEPPFALVAPVDGLFR